MGDERQNSWRSHRRALWEIAIFGLCSGVLITALMLAENRLVGVAHASDMKKCVWVRPEVVARIEYLEWTDGDHLRHAKFAELRTDKDARSITKEHAGETWFYSLG